MGHAVCSALTRAGANNGADALILNRPHTYTDLFTTSKPCKTFKIYFMLK